MEAQLDPDSDLFVDGEINIFQKLGMMRSITQKCWRTLRTRNRSFLGQPGRHATSFETGWKTTASKIYSRRSSSLHVHSTYAPVFLSYTTSIYFFASQWPCFTVPPLGSG
ncbi:hypothetical protein FA13DRAFT_1134736 [Coprinellus micaceus]|uniref:Uncharacterized protein n=1 Tax=Coprinellus micaceus TaxID=71717 RepID=A0A4Y7RJM7_COPMI|nr:hypothetical protein FA13DRAFT_1134736 [Coprinellus micaceus]